MHVCVTLFLGSTVCNYCIYLALTIKYRALYIGWLKKGKFFSFSFFLFCIFNQAHAGHIVPGFLELPLSVNVCVCVCVCVCVFMCPPPRLLITIGVMWCDIDPKRLVK